MQGCYTQTLQLAFLNRSVNCKESINYAYCNVQGLSPKFKSEVQLCQPVHQVGSHLLSHFFLFLHEVGRQHESHFLFKQEARYLWSVFSYALHVSEVKKVANFQISR